MASFPLHGSWLRPVEGGEVAGQGRQFIRRKTLGDAVHDGGPPLAGLEFLQRPQQYAAGLSCNGRQGSMALAGIAMTTAATAGQKLNVGHCAGRHAVGAKASGQQPGRDQMGCPAQQPAGVHADHDGASGFFRT